MKMLLLSSGKALLGPIGQTLVGMVNDPAQTKVAYIPNASEENQNQEKLEASKSLLTKLGFQLIEVDLNEPEKFSKLDDCDVMYVKGVDTLHLLKKVRESEFDKKLKQFLQKDKIYVGSSAGSMIMGQSIEDIVESPNATGKETQGLGFVAFSVLPHYNADVSEHEPQIECVACNRGLPVVAINDEQAILVDEAGTKILGPGELYLWNLPDGLWEIKISF